MRAVSAEFQPDAEFGGAPGDGVGDHAVDAERGQQQRAEGEQQHQPHLELA
ncbi:MAG: hypothetical protein ACRD01_00715 [Terriglobales bacterium]